MEILSLSLSFYCTLFVFKLVYFTRHHSLNVLWVSYSIPIESYIEKFYSVVLMYAIEHRGSEA